MTGGADDAYGVHLTFGAEPSTAMVVSWLSHGPATRPAVRCAARPGALGPPVPATIRSYRDARTGERVFVHHASLTGLEPATDYAFTLEHDGRPQGADGSFRTAPGSRAAFGFTFFGDQGTDRPYDPYGSPASGYAVVGVERCAPLFALTGGDLSYANQREDPVRTWSDWFTMISPSAGARPWMPCVGNHEIERGNGALGLAAYQTYFELPPNGDEGYLAGLWYAFTVGAVRFVVVSADDVCYQNSGPIYLRGFSAGRQTAWLARTLEQARADPGIDWIVVAMHHAALSTSADHNGADLGIREAWLPLFDRYGVDLVLYGHEHHYERSHPVRGIVPGSPTLAPRPVASAVGPGGAVVDTSAGTVHLMAGTGGSSSPSTDTLLDPPAGRIVVGVRDPEPGRRHRAAVRALEDAAWLAFRAPDHPYAFAGFEVDPGEAGGLTSIRVTAYDSGSPDPVPFDRVTLVRPRTDAAPTG
ncbi:MULTISPECIES: purple acid phosphatase family protein [Frankia]|uniref:purple acid phosphatase family protein n=1 Tax=Frankia TaxID=1854 RepID=UPI0002DE3F24|nr:MULTISPECIES: metallophosphoesterase family protein [Frankia]